MELKIENLYKSYKRKLTRTNAQAFALENINITMTAGIYGLLGENGAGKSTLMRILATVDFQTKGSVSFNGKDISSLDEEYRDILGYMPQDYSIFPNYTARGFLEYLGTLKGIEHQKLKQRIPEVLEFVNLSDVADKKAEKFSGGMKRRLGIAQAILGEPKILILDEPTAGLDPKERIRFANIISEMSKDKIVILSTHIVSDIEAIANSLIIIKSGKLLQMNTIDGLIEKVEGMVFEATIDQATFNKLLDERKVVRRRLEINQENKLELIRVRYVGEAYEGIENQLQKPSLEDYYVAECL